MYSQGSMQRFLAFSYSRSLYRIIGFLAIILATSVFLFRDLVWTGQWHIEEKAGTRSSTISRPWPASAYAIDSSGLTVLGESVYITLHLPRAFSSMEVLVEGNEGIPQLEVGVGRKLNTHSYAVTTAQRVNDRQWVAHLSLAGIDQSANALNVVLRFPAAAKSATHLDRFAFTFYRSPKTLSSFFSTLWSRQRAFPLFK